MKDGRYTAVDRPQLHTRLSAAARALGDQFRFYRNKLATEGLTGDELEFCYDLLQHAGY